jgi:hypothetical protein
MLCNENAPLSKVIGTVVGSEPPLLTALIEISFCSVGKAVSYNARVPGSNSIGNIAFFGGKTCSTATVASVKAFTKYQQTKCYLVKSKIKNKKYHTVGTFPTTNRKMVERDQFINLSTNT